RRCWTQMNTDKTGSMFRGHDRGHEAFNAFIPVHLCSSVFNLRQNAFQPIQWWGMKFALPLLAALALASPLVHAAASAQALTPIDVSVLGNESKVFSVRFLDAAGAPAVGESVQF